MRVRLTHPALDFWIDVRVRDFDGRWLAVADIADAPEVGTGETRRAALHEALAPFGHDLAGELVERAEQQLAWTMVAGFVDNDTGYRDWLAGNQTASC